MGGTFLATPKDFLMKIFIIKEVKVCLYIDCHNIKISLYTLYCIAFHNLSSFEDLETFVFVMVTQRQLR